MKLQNKNFFKKLNKDLNKDLSHYDDKVLTLEHTGLFTGHEVGRGLNPGEPTLLTFDTRIIEATAIHFQACTSGLLQIFYYSSSGGGYGSDSGTFVEVRKNGKNATFFWRNHDEELSEHLAKRLGIESASHIYNSDTLKTALIEHGYSVLVCFDFTGRICQKLPHHGMGSYLKPSYLKQGKRGLELGWVSSGTYNALPNVLKITKSKGVKTTRLDSLGVETDGYYSHDYKCEVLTTQAKAAKAFFGKRFKKVKGE